MTPLTRAGASAAILAGIFTCVYRPWHLRWGADHDEVRAAMPGDDLVRHAHFAATRGITVEARPEEVWPWIVQVGYGRAGFYAYDLLDVVLPCLASASARDERRECLGKKSAEMILQDLQGVQIGTWIPMAPGRPSRETAFQVSTSAPGC